MNEIFEYIRRNQGGVTNKIGVIFGTIDEGVIKIGWSKCNVKSGDVFDAGLGIDLAKARAFHETHYVPVPACIKRQLRRFSARSIRYFKDAKTIELPS